MAFDDASNAWSGGAQGLFAIGKYLTDQQNQVIARQQAVADNTRKSLASAGIYLPGLSDDELMEYVRRPAAQVQSPPPTAQPSAPTWATQPPAGQPAPGANRPTLGDTNPTLDSGPSPTPSNVSSNPDPTTGQPVPGSDTTPGAGKVPVANTGLQGPSAMNSTNVLSRDPAPPTSDQTLAARAGGPPTTMPGPTGSVATAPSPLNQSFKPPRYMGPPNLYQEVSDAMQQTQYDPRQAGFGGLTPFADNKGFYMLPPNMERGYANMGVQQLKNQGALDVANLRFGLSPQFLQENPTITVGGQTFNTATAPHEALMAWMKGIGKNLYSMHLVPDQDNNLQIVPVRNQNASVTLGQPGATPTPTKPPPVTPAGVTKAGNSADESRAAALAEGSAAFQRVLAAEQDPSLAKEIQNSQVASKLLAYVPGYGSDNRQKVTDILSQTTMSQKAKDLLADQMQVVESAITATKGQPRAQLIDLYKQIMTSTLQGDPQQALRIGATKLAAAMGTIPKPLLQRSFSAIKTDPDQWLQQLQQTAGMGQGGDAGGAGAPSLSDAVAKANEAFARIQARAGGGASSATTADASSSR